MVSTEPKTTAAAAAAWQRLLGGLAPGIFCCLLEGDDTKVCGLPRWKTVWNNDTGADILLASYWSHLQSDWFCLMPACPAEFHRQRHTPRMTPPPPFVSSSSAKLSFFSFFFFWHSNNTITRFHTQRCCSKNGRSFVSDAEPVSAQSSSCEVRTAAKWVKAWRGTSFAQPRFTCLQLLPSFCVLWNINQRSADIYLPGWHQIFELNKHSFQPKYIPRHFEKKYWTFLNVHFSHLCLLLSSCCSCPAGQS